MDNVTLKFIVKQFQVTLNNTNITPITQGYINDTFLVKDNFETAYILQRVNTNIFKNINGLHQNFNKALSQLKSDDYCEFMLIKTHDNSFTYKHNEDYWRLLTYINNSVAYNYTKDPKIAFETGKVLGKFHTLLQHENNADYVNTIENLNHLPTKINEFQTALKNTSFKRKETAKTLIEFTVTNKALFNGFYLANLPLRICHNDSKLNNILFGKTTKKSLCFIDLDTIMKGYFHYDFGDAVRTAVSESNEDETRLENIKFNRLLFESFIKGLSPYSKLLSKKEINFLPISCALMPFIHGLRALTDYLNGNIYYKVSYENQNLDRCKSLFKFTKRALDEQSFIEKVIMEKLIKA